MTTAEYLATPETVLPRELAFGALRVADAPTTSHQRVVLGFALALAPFVRERQLGEVLLAPTDVILDAANALVVQPDLIFVSLERSHIVSDRVYGAPDLAVEVLSPHPRIGELQERIGWFAKYGVRECWLADAIDKSIVVLSLDPHGIGRRSIHRGADPVQTRVIEGVRVTPLDVLGW
jgi:Uma2 family endonuclease